jgi:hypothetical protein
MCSNKLKYLHEITKSIFKRPKLLNLIQKKQKIYIHPCEEIESAKFQTS